MRPSRFSLTLVLSTYLMCCNGKELTTDEILHILGNDDIADVFEPSLNEDNYEEDDEAGNSSLTWRRKQPLLPRKATSNSGALWNTVDGVPTVRFAYGSTPVPHSTLQKAMEHIETHTCIRFQEANFSLFRSRIVFDDSSGCSSPIGKMSFLFGLIPDQRVNLGYRCSSVQTIVHEICHALGLHHEQARSDRDDYVTVLYENLSSSKTINFVKENTKNFNTEYDFTSILHYGQFGFTNNGKQTLTTVDPLMKGLIMMPRLGLSFMDKSVLNHLYNCVDTWLTECGTNGTSPCLNNGYMGPACECICPLGTSGDLCEVKEKEYSEALVELLTPETEVITEPTTITSMNSTENLKYTAFTKLIRAPLGYRVVLTVLEFDTHFKLSKPPRCAYEGVEIGRSSTPGTGTVYCGRDLKAGNKFTSSSNLMTVFYWKQTLTTETQTGFKFSVRFEWFFQHCKNEPPSRRGLFARCYSGGL